VECTGLTLAIRHGQGDAILVKPDAANPECGAGAKTTYLYPKVLSRVVPIVDNDTRNSRSGLGKIDLNLSFSNDVATYGVDRHRKIKTIFFNTGTCHYNRCQL